MCLYSLYVHVHIVATNVADVSVALTEKKVLYHFTRKLDDNEVVRQKKDIVLECMINDPRPSCKWHKDGKPLEVRTPTGRCDRLTSCVTAPLSATSCLTVQ